MSVLDGERFHIGGTPNGVVRAPPRSWVEVAPSGGRSSVGQVTSERARAARRKQDEQAAPVAGARDPRLALLGQLGNQAAGREIARLRAAERRLDRFESNEHKKMGDLGSGGATMELAPGMTVSFGDMTALAGDYFGSLEDMQNLAKIPGSTGAPFNRPGTVDEVKYALYVEVQGSLPKEQFDEKVINGAKKRYFNLAAHNSRTSAGRGWATTGPRSRRSRARAPPTTPAATAPTTRRRSRRPCAPAPGCAVRSTRRCCRRRSRRTT